MPNIQTILDHQFSKFQSNHSYQKISSLPLISRWLTIFGIFLLSQCLLFGLLYFIFGELVVIGFFASILSGLATGVGAIPTLFFKDISDKLFNSLLGAAAGAMLFVISEEIIPETHTKGRSRVATFSLMIGFIVMMVLDNILS